MTQGETITYLLKQLACMDNDGRHAMHLLTTMGQAAAPALAVALSSPDTTVRRAVSLILARMGTAAQPAIAALGAALEDSDDEVRFKSAFVLKVLGVEQYREAADVIIRDLAQPMGMIDSLEPFVAESPVKRGIISRATELNGEVIVDVTGQVFFAPLEDYRGGGMGSVPLLGVHGAAGTLVRLTGVFDHDIGIWAETITKISDG